MACVTVETLAQDLADLGVTDGAVVLAHISLPRIGLVVGGEQAVIEVLLRAVGPSGTVVMPAQSWQLCDPEYLGDPDVPREVWPVIRVNLPGYDPAVTPTRTMGAVAEQFRTVPGAVRSAHPHRSFAALGPQAAQLPAAFTAARAATVAPPGTTTEAVPMPALRPAATAPVPAPTLPWRGPAAAVPLDSASASAAAPNPDRRGARPGFAQR